MAQPFLSVIIPARNEAERLPLALIDLDKHLSDGEHSYEILVVDDGSKDDTAKIVGNFSRMMRNLKLIHNDEQKGKGAAVRQGMLLARGKYRAMLDADGAVHPKYLYEIQPHFKEGAHIIIGSRVLGAGRWWPQIPPHRQLMERLSNLLLRPVLHLGVGDPGSGFKVFSEEVVERLFSESRIPGWGFDLEILALAKNLGYQIKEIPISWSHDASRQMPYYGYLQALADAVKVRWWLSRGRYGLDTNSHEYS